MGLLSWGCYFNSTMIQIHLKNTVRAWALMAIQQNFPSIREPRLRAALRIKKLQVRIEYWGRGRQGIHTARAAQCFLKSPIKRPFHIHVTQTVTPHIPSSSEVQEQISSFNCMASLSLEGNTKQKHILLYFWNAITWNLMTCVNNQGVTSDHGNQRSLVTVSYTHLTLPTKRIV